MIQIQKNIFTRAIEGLMQEANKLVIEHIELARNCAIKWHRHNPFIRRDDYFQTACLGLISSSRRYSKSKSKAKFSSYAYSAMEGKVRDMIAVHLTGTKEGLKKGYKIPRLLPINEEMLDGEDLGFYHHRFEIEVPDVRLNTNERLTNINRRVGRDEGITTVALAEHIGVTKDCIRKWLKGKAINADKCDKLEEAITHFETLNNKRQRQVKDRLDQIKKRMHNQGLTITDLAKKIRITQPTLGRWLSGYTKLTETNYKKIVAVLREHGGEGDKN